MNLCKKYFEGRIDIAFAFLFGLAARSKIRKEGDVDVGIYFWPKEDIEWKVYQSVREKRLESVSFRGRHLCNPGVDFNWAFFWQYSFLF